MLVTIILKIFLKYYLKYSKYFAGDWMSFVERTTVYGCHFYVDIKEN